MTPGNSNTSLKYCLSQMIDFQLIRLVLVFKCRLALVSNQQDLARTLLICCNLKYTKQDCTVADTPLGADPLEQTLLRADIPPKQTPPTPWSRHIPGADTPQSRPPGSRHPPRDGHCCGRYASYWNAFLFLKIKLRMTSSGCSLKQQSKYILFSGN